jgi:small subunit ribosomal protein S16
MATRIRLRRMGAKKRPHYRVVVADQRAPRDGRFIENIGRYHPLEDPSLIEIDEERALHWLRTGAQPSEQVQNLMTKVGIWEKFAADRPRAAKVNSRDKKVREGKPEAPKTSKKAQAKATTAEAEGATETAAPAPTAADDSAPADASAAEVVETSSDERAPAATPEAGAAGEE